MLGFLQDLLNSITKQHDAMVNIIRKIRTSLRKWKNLQKEREERKKREEERRDKKKRRKDRQNDSLSSENSNRRGSKNEEELKGKIRTILKTGIKVPQQFYDDDEIQKLF